MTKLPLLSVFDTTESVPTLVTFWITGSFKKVAILKKNIKE